MENMENKSACPTGGCCPGVCRCMHHKVMPILIILFGLTFLFQAFWVIDEDTVAVIWPIIVIVGGIMKFFGGACKCYNKHC